jgi:uncharacterized protein YkwD
MKRLITIVSVLVLLSLSASQCGPVPPPTGSCGDDSQPYYDEETWDASKTWTYCSNDDIEAMYDEHNNWRRPLGREDLLIDYPVQDVASYWSTYLACANKRGHVVLAEDGNVVLNHVQRVRDIGENYAGALVYENVAYQQNLSVQGAFMGWINSDYPVHPENIERPDVTSVGVGCVHIDPPNVSWDEANQEWDTFEYYWTVKFIDR